MKGKTLKQITNTPKAGLKELPSLPDNEEFNVEIISKDSGKVYTVSTDAFNSNISTSSSLFPNGIKYIVTGDAPEVPVPNTVYLGDGIFEYELQAGDAGKLIIIKSSDITTYLPELTPFQINENVGITSMSGVVNVKVQFAIQDDPIEMLSGAGNGCPINETVIFTNKIIDGENKIIPLSTIAIDKKTALKYLYDQSQNAIPLSGTEVGNPVTGDIEFQDPLDSGEKSIYTNYGISGYKKFFFPEDGTVGIEVSDTYTTSILLEEARITVNITDPVSPGIKGIQDFSANITDLDYTQKIYVGFRGTATLSSGTVIVATDKVKTGYKIYVSVNTPSGTQGFLSAPTGSIVDATSFVINSTSATDDSTVNWWIAP